MSSSDLRPAPAGILGPPAPGWEPPAVIIDRFMIRVRAELGPPDTWRRWPGQQTAGVVHRYCEHVIDRPLSPIPARRVFLAIQWRLGVTAWDLEDAIWGWENRCSGAHAPEQGVGHKAARQRVSSPPTLASRPSVR